MKTRRLKIQFVLLLTCMFLFGAFNQGTYGHDPRKADSLAELIDKTNETVDKFDTKIRKSQIKSLFIRPEGRESKVLLMLVAYDEGVTNVAQEFLQSNQTPLIFSISTLPFSEVDFEPTSFRFEQNGQIWQPQLDTASLDLFPLGKETKFGGVLNDGQIHQGIIMLPESFDLDHPITVKYGNDQKRLRFD
ncbi:hypothetical protein GWO43_02775 [candidate division KSB1 bacterium]|nr:hypothetical protein [candidate division KSB1 bacterium]NIR69857.1 hypothetical protein [candidate division KSB1 bacterium]NIS22976.1 hypothetical protein [candidate division KSB1 bacterium]NIT69834.1 hypothetical protein [candidate division KSB1 bacterium]NIU25756.1 hypothetical protein [candidate division KSB1 bacterium]